MILFLIPVSIFALDQLSKFYISKNIPLGHKIEVIKDKFYITNEENSGAAYGLFGKNRNLLLFSSIGALIFIIYSFIISIIEKKNNLSKLGSALTLGGGLGNIYDRFFKKKVTDFIYIKGKNAPIFNIADLAILIGLIFMIIGDLKKKK